MGSFCSPAAGGRTTGERNCGGGRILPISPWVRGGQDVAIRRRRRIPSGARAGRCARARPRRSGSPRRAKWRATPLRDTISVEPPRPDSGGQAADEQT